MGDRNNPIKFGPEWLRNLARERSAGSSGSNSQTAASSSGANHSGTLPGASGGITNAPPATSLNTFNTASQKVQLAKLRYGREEMLALFDRTSEAPPELKGIEILYQSRGKPPVALNNTFEDDMRETMRTGPPIGAMATGERFGIGRGMGRGAYTNEAGRARLAFVRQQSTGRATARHLGNPRMPGYSGGADDDISSTLRPWSNTNGGNTATRNPTDQPEWAPNKMYRSKRPGSSTNWRQTSRDDDEWRASENNRTRSVHQDKWERDWGDRPNQDKQQSWGSNRRTWVGGDSQNEENLPEWAVDNPPPESCSGTFDSSGAFHGYSNDDTNLPKSQESAYALTRSHTHGSFIRTKTAEEGSEEWWASEKAKKLSPKRFDASDIKFKKPGSIIPELRTGNNSSNKSNTGKEDNSGNKGLEKLEASSAAATMEMSENNASGMDESFSKKSVRFAESKTFDALMRSDINLEEASDERGNFQSVMINPNNSLRQKHQNIVASVSNNGNRKPGILQLLQNAQNSQNSENECSKLFLPEDKMVDQMMDMTLEDKDMISKLPPNEGLMTNQCLPGISSTMSSAVNSTPAMQLKMSSPVHPTQVMALNQKSNIVTSGKQPTGLQTSGIQNVGLTNSALNASLGLPLGPSSNAISQSMGIPIQGIPPPVLPNQGVGNSVGSTALQTGGQGITGYQPGMSAASVVNRSLFIGNANPSPMQSSNDMQMNHGNQTNIFPMHGLQHSGSQAAFNSSMYSNMMQQSSVPAPPNPQSLAEQWYYEDPEKNIQGPFSSKEMYNWYRAGFFSSSLMVRRACDGIMRPLGSYGPVVPFAQMDILSSFPMASGFEARNQPAHDSMLNPQPGLGMDEAMQFGSVGLIRNPSFGQQQMVDSLWSQPSPPDLMWMQQAMNARSETRVNNLPMFFWDQQPSAIASNSLLPEEIAKEMKTEDQILAQLRASQNINQPQKLPYMEHPAVSAPPGNKPEESFSVNVHAAPNLEELQKLIEEETLKNIPLPPELKAESDVTQVSVEGVSKFDQYPAEANPAKLQPLQHKAPSEPKLLKQAKVETEKSTKNRENNLTKTKNSKKPKEEKKEDFTEMKKEEDNKAEKRSEEPSPTKGKKDDKSNKKELDKEKKEWIKEGFTIVKTEKNVKDSKKKTEDTKAAEEAERKRKEEERLAVEEDKKRKQIEAYKKQQEMQQQQQQRQAESVVKKAPWSAVANQAMQAPNKDGLTLAEIQRLEREKKLEQMKEQQQMMQIIAQQQAVALAREQEMQAGLGWAKKKANLNAPGQSLAEIQAETRKQAVAAATTTTTGNTQSVEEPQAASQSQTAINNIPWGNAPNGAGFWDSPPSQPQQKPVETSKLVDQNKAKKKPIVTTTVPVKKEVTPAAEFDIWCTAVLAPWSAKIDVPTFVGFLKDIESPYEVKDYVKCYLGDSKESNDFSRQFLERRSKLLRVATKIPSDDLCSPAAAVNPRTTSGSDYQEVKNKNKKTKKNKMLKVDARILGFSVTAAEDRINVGDIDTV